MVQLNSALASSLATYPRLSSLSQLAARPSLKREADVGKLTNRRHASSTATVKTTCLYDFHKSRQARMEAFAGYSMPIVYKDQSIKSEHMQTRNHATAFDVSHMMQTIVQGADRCQFIESLTVTDVAGMGLNKCSLSVFTNEAAGIIDDCIISKTKDYLFVVSNAGNADEVWAWLNTNLAKQQKEQKLDVKLERLLDRGLIALQGPKAGQVLQKMVDVNLDEVLFMNTTEADLKLAGVGVCRLTRCGYTGEDGFEISVAPDKAELLMQTLCADERVKPAGLGARDTLRLEAGLCLHGHDITAQTSPVEAALSWTIQKRRRAEAGFPGSATVLDQLKKGTPLKRVGLVATSTGPPAREGSQVLAADAKTELGTVTSGTFAPSLNNNIAMAYLPAKLANKFDEPVKCSVRGKLFDYKLTKMPFVPSNYYTKKRS